MKEQLDRFIKINGILHSAQSGFRKGHSFETSLNLVLANWKEELEKGNKVVSVFLDLQRAFEIIDRSRLLGKLHNYGIRGTGFKWIQNYLDERIQLTKFEDKISAPRNVP